jgi:hypothetical protein
MLSICCTVSVPTSTPFLTKGVCKHKQVYMPRANSMDASLAQQVSSRLCNALTTDTSRDPHASWIAAKDIIRSFSEYEGCTMKKKYGDYLACPNGILIPRRRTWFQVWPAAGIRPSWCSVPCCAAFVGCNLNTLQAIVTQRATLPQNSAATLCSPGSFAKSVCVGLIMKGCFRLSERRYLPCHAAAPCMQFTHIDRVTSISSLRVSIFAKTLDASQHSRRLHLQSSTALNAFGTSFGRLSSQ